MNTRILTSLVIIGLVSIVLGMGTYAYFSDTETSTGNTFTAGSIDLKIDNHCYLNGEEVSDCTWDLTDLTDELFFNFADIKPGDWGEDTVSIHVYDNDAWVCVIFKNLESSDETCVEPELDVEADCGEDGKGELAENLYFFFWVDMCDEPELNACPGDNIYQPECDIPLMAGYASEVLDGRIYTLADSQENNVGGIDGYPLLGSTTYYIGKVWCFGTMNIDPETGQITCDGSSVGNEAQTDSLTGDIEFYAVQERNNPNFLCSQLAE